MIYPVAKFFIPFLQKLFVKKVTGFENIPKKGPFILAANHQCHLDGIILGIYVVQRTNQKIHFLAKKEFTSYFGKSIEKQVYTNWAEVLYVEKEGAKGKGKKAIAKASNLLNRGGIIGIFPEGTRTYNGSLLEGRTGIVRIIFGAKKEVPIVPVGIYDAWKMLPRNNAIPRLWRARISIKIGKPFYITKYKKKKMTGKILRIATTGIMKKIAKEANLSYEY